MSRKNIVCNLVTPDKNVALSNSSWFFHREINEKMPYWYYLVENGTDTIQRGMGEVICKPYELNEATLNF